MVKKLQLNLKRRYFEIQKREDYEEQDAIRVFCTCFLRFFASSCLSVFTPETLYNNFFDFDTTYLIFISFCDFIIMTAGEFIGRACQVMK